jgi:predicted Zn-dependent peptidase
VQRDGLVTDISAYLGTMGGAFDVRDPSAFLVEARHPPDVPVDRVLAALDEELERVAADGLEPGELERVAARFAGRQLRRLDSVLGRALTFSVLEQQRSAPQLANELPARIAEVPPEAVAAAAATLRPGARAVLELRAGSVR